MTDRAIVEVSTTDGIFVVTFNQPSIHGPAQVETIAETLRSFIQDRGPDHLIVDFADVVFFSSQMLGLLVDLWRRMKAVGGKLVISGINPQLNRVFRITHLDKIFEFYDDTQAAVAAIGAE